MIRLDNWCVVAFNEDVHCVTHTLFPVHQLLQFKCLLAVCKNSMKAALICLTLLLSCASSGTGGVETWGWDEHFVMWQCLAKCYQKLFQHVKYLSPMVLPLPFSCFEVMSHSWWTSIVLFPGVQFNLSRSDSHHCFASRKWRTYLEGFTFSLRWQHTQFEMVTLWRVSPADGQCHSKCPDSHTYSWAGGWLVKTWRNCKGEAFLREGTCSTISPLCPITQLWQFVRFSCLQGLNESCIGRFPFAHFHVVRHMEAAKACEDEKHIL